MLIWNRSRLLSLFVWALISIFGIDSTGLAEPPERESQVRQALLVQVAMQQAREFLSLQQYGSAIQLLEAHLAKIDGNATYLALLEQAYRGHIKQLQQKNEFELARHYQQKLAILDPSLQATNNTQDNDQYTDRNVPDNPASQNDHSSSETKIRGQNKDRARSKPEDKSSQQTIAFAHQHFISKKYQQASHYYQRAYRATGDLSQLSKERWAYCKLHWVAQQMNQPMAGVPNWRQLENEVLSAIQLAPRYEFAKVLLQKIRQALKQSTSKKIPTTTQHRAKKGHGWQITESANFRVFHHHEKLAQKVLSIAENTRNIIHRKWFAKRVPSWSSKCNIYLYPNAERYSQEQGVSPSMPAHCNIETDLHHTTRICRREIFLQAQHPYLLKDIIPHEVTHVTLAGLVTNRPIPRWADEGMAMLSETDARIQHHLSVLKRAYAQKRVFSVQQLMRMEKYPAPNQIHIFYAQSLSLVQYFLHLRGEKIFLRFLKEAERAGYPTALKKYYKFYDMSDLQIRWTRFVMQQHLQSPVAFQGK